MTRSETDAAALDGGADAPITRAEFDRLIEIVRDMADDLSRHTHGYSSPDSTYGESTYGPDSEVLNTLWRRLDALRDREPEPREDDGD